MFPSHDRGGATPTLQQVTDQGSITTTPITASIISASATITSNILNIGTRVKAIGSSLEFAGDTLDFVDGNSVNYLFRGINAGAFEAYHAGNKKLETTTTGVSITGSLTLSGSGHITASGDISSSATIFGDTGSFSQALITNTSLDDSLLITTTENSSTCWSASFSLRNFI